MPQSRRSRLSSTNSSQALLSSESSDLLDVRVQVHHKRPSQDSDDLSLDPVSSSAYNDVNGGQAQIQHTLPKHKPSADFSDDTDLDSVSAIYESIPDRGHTPVVQDKLYIENEIRSDRGGKRKVRKNKRRSSGDRSRITRAVSLDKLIEEYKCLLTENKRLKAYYTKHNILTVVLIVVCLLVMLAVGLQYFLRQKQPDNKMCLECTLLTEVLKEDDFQALVTIDKPGVCCVKDPAKLIERAIEKTEKLGPWVEQVFEGLDTVVDNLKTNATNTRQLLDNLKGLQAMRNAGKGSIHLKGTYNKNLRQVQWNTTDPSTLQLTRNRTSVLVNDPGNYVLYTHLAFNVPRNYRYTRRMSYTIYKKTTIGVLRFLEEPSQLADVNVTSDVVCSGLRVANFVGGDSVYFQVGVYSEAAVSKKEHVHEFGMFKL